MSNGRNRQQPRKSTAKAKASGPNPPLRSSSSSDGEITIFLSYSRADDAVYRMVRPFKELLGHLVYAKSGRKIKTFLDQDNIGWGEIWRDRLESEILSASVFIPLLSASYLDSENCRMEFNRFQTTATALGVKELLLPVVLLNAPAIFNENSTDDVVREAAARQWEVIEDAVLADAGSSAWKMTMARLADRFVAAYEAAEATLAELDEADLAAVSPDGLDPDDDDDDSPGLTELIGSIETAINELTRTSQDMGPAIEALGIATTSSGTLREGQTVQQVQAWSLRTARAFKEPAERISEVGERMFNTTKELDVDMQRLRRIAVELLSVSPGVAANYDAMINQLAGLDAVSAQLNELLAKMKPAEYISVPLRKSLRPARRGLTRVTDSLHLIETWQTIGSA
jgi:hypothetical protein